MYAFTTCTRVCGVFRFWLTIVNIRYVLVTSGQSFREDLQRLFEETRQEKSGNVATYIPQLATVNPDYWAMSFCSIDGQTLDLGDWGM